jgi:Asp-tRNA(Asn)/Glu-tRNA(Gln) amidotransferase A subunit family amidase
MKFSKSLIIAIVVAAFFTLTAGQAQAQREHPAYIHALSDLRLMRAYLDRLTPSERVDDESQQAIDEIDAAIHEIKIAAIEDGKDLRDHAFIDAHITPSNRFHKAREAGDAAWHDLDREEDNGFAHGLKRRAMDHIEKANHIVDHIVRRWDNR